MPDDINGNFSLVAGYKATTGQTIQASQHNPVLEDMSNAMTDRVNRRGTAPMLANLPMGGFKATGMGAGTAPTDGATKSQVDAATPIGCVMDWAGATAPVGWLLCYGQAVSRVDYATLFAVCGTTFGAGNGSSTFNVPDLRGRVVAGKDNMGGTDANRIDGSIPQMPKGTTLGVTGGEYFHTLTIAELAAHTHAVSGTTSTEGNHTHQAPSNTGVGSNTLGSGGGGATISTSTGAAGAHNHSLSGTATSTGSGAGHNNMQPTMILNKIIKAL